MRLEFFSAVALLAGASISSAQETAHPVDSFQLDGTIEWSDDGAVFHDGRRAKRSLTDEEKKVDRAALLDQAILEARAEDKLVLWYINRIIENESRGAQMYRAPILDLYMRQVVFGDADVATLVNSRFIPVRAVCDETLSARFDFRPLDFIEPAVVFLNGEGEVVHYVERIRTFDGPWFSALLLNVLDHAGNRRSVDGLGVEELSALGLYEEAYDILLAAEDKGAEQFIALAAQARRLRRPEDALVHLSSARERLEQEAPARGRRRDPAAERHRELQGRLDYEQGHLLSLTGDRLGALPFLDNAFRSGIAEAGYLLALNRLALGDEVGAMGQFRLVAQRHADTLTGQKALANTTLGPDDRPIGAAFSGFERMGFLDDAAYEGLPRDTTWAGEAASPEALTLRGVRFLLSMQRANGGFTDSRYAYWGTSKITPNAWIAITALACTALLESREMVRGEVDSATINAALKSGEDFMFDPKRLNRGENEDVYADAYRIGYLTTVLKLHPERSEWANAQAQTIVAEAQERQRDGGFFAHEYSNAFCTAAMVWSLLEAREVGVPIPDAILEKGAEAIESARYENGAYNYGGSARDGREGSLKDSAGRMPICEGVQLRLDTGSPSRLKVALLNYWEFFERIEGVRRNDFHSDGELAGFFFFHDLMHSSQVLKLVPQEMSAPMRARFLEVLQQIPEMDGSYIDSHEIGRSYATAMALLTLRRIASLDE